MSPLPLPLQLVLLIFSGWINRRQLDVIDYLQEENRVLKERLGGSPPARDTHTRWSTFLKAHWECLTASDFLSVEVFTLKGLVTQYVLFFIDIASRSVHIAGITPHPDNAWVTQIARNITAVSDGFLRHKRYLLLDRDTKYSDAFRDILVREGTHVIRLPPRSPNLNAFADLSVPSKKNVSVGRSSSDSRPFGTRSQRI